MIFGEFSHIIALETRFYSINGWVLFKLIEQGHASCRLFRLLIAKPRVVVDEEGADIAVDEWKDSSVFRGVRHVTAVHENVLATTVTMEVSEHEHVTLLDEIMNHLLCVVNGGMQNFRGRFPATIQIAASQRAAIVAVNDAVWV